MLWAIREIDRCITDTALVCGLLDKLEQVLPNAVISDIIFWDFRNLSPEQILAEALRREAYHADHPPDDGTHPSTLMTRPQMLAAVRAIWFGYQHPDVISRLLADLHAALPHLAPAELIRLGRQDRMPEEIVDEAIRREKTYRAES